MNLQFFLYFGFSLTLIFFFYYYKLDKKGSRIGTPHWMAPEIMRGEKYDEFSDVYSYGMVVWYLNFYFFFTCLFNLNFILLKKIINLK